MTNVTAVSALPKGLSRPAKFAGFDDGFWDKRGGSGTYFARSKSFINARTCSFLVTVNSQS